MFYRQIIYPAQDYLTMKIGELMEKRKCRPIFTTFHGLLNLNLKDHGFKVTDKDFSSILNSREIERIDSLKIFFNQIESNKWDGKDRLEGLIRAAKLSGDFNLNLSLIKKWFCTTYGFAMRGIDPKTPETVYSRVVFILYSEQRGFGKTEFFRKIGLMGAIEKSTGLVGTEMYAETTGELPKDERNFEINLISDPESWFFE